MRYETEHFYMVMDEVAFTIWAKGGKAPCLVLREVQQRVNAEKVLGSLESAWQQDEEWRRGEGQPWPVERTIQSHPKYPLRAKIKFHDKDVWTTGEVDAIAVGFVAEEVQDNDGLLYVPVHCYRDDGKQSGIILVAESNIIEVTLTSKDDER